MQLDACFRVPTLQGMAMHSERDNLDRSTSRPERAEDMAVRRPWQSPKVILSQIEGTNGGINALTDVDFSQTS